MTKVGLTNIFDNYVFGIVQRQTQFSDPRTHRKERGNESLWRRGALNTSLHNLLEAPLSTPAHGRRFLSSSGPQSSLPYRTYLGSWHWAPHSRFSSRCWNCSKAEAVDLPLLLPSGAASAAAGTRPSAQGRHSQHNFLGNTVYVHRTNFSRNSLKSLACELGTV